MNYEQLFMALSFLGVFLFGTFIGGLVASRLGIYLRISKKEDYEAKVKQLEQMLETLQKPEDLNLDLQPSELFPPGVSPEYGLPRKLTKD
jgi:hypothetical protein